MLLSDKEKRKFRNQISLDGIGVKGQELIKAAKVLVIGAGSLGAGILQNLSATGIGEIGIIDYQVIKEDRISSQTLYGEKDIGKLKSIVVKERLENIYPSTKYEIHNILLGKNNIIEFLKVYDIIIDASNLPDTHYLIVGACSELHKTWIFSGYTSNTGFITVLNFRDKTNANLENIINKLSENYYALSTLTVMLSSIVVNEAIKIILSDDTVLCGSVFQINIQIYQNFQYLMKYLTFLL